MSNVVLTEGFDMYNGVAANTGVRALWSPSGGVTTGSTLVAGRFGGQCLQKTGDLTNDRIWTRSLLGGANLPAFAMGVAIRFTTMPTALSGQAQLGFLNGSTWQDGVRFDNNGAVYAYRHTALSSGTALGHSSNGIIHLNTWHYVEMEIVIDDTVGSFNIYVDGASVLALSGVDTRNGAPTGIDTIAVCGVDQSASTVFQCDDIYLVDAATRLGERRIETLRPASAISKVWTPLSGTNNYDMVNETLVDGDTSYNSSSNVGDRDLYAISPLSSTPATIDAVNVVSFGEKTDAATRTIYNSVQSAGTNSDGSAFNLAASYGRFDRIIQLDPNGGGAWNASRVNGLYIGPGVAS